MIHIALRSEYSFRKTFAHLENLVQIANDYIGIADINSTYGHVALEKLCKKYNKKPIFGVRVMATIDPKKRNGRKPNFGPEYIVIAKNTIGLQEIYNLVKTSFDNFYYHPIVSLTDIWNLSENVFVIAECFNNEERIDFIALTPTTLAKSLNSNLPKILICNNLYITPDDKKTYELFAGARKTGQGYNYLFENGTTPNYILGFDDYISLFGIDIAQKAYENNKKVAELCSNVTLPKANRIKYIRNDNNLKEKCIKGAFKRKINLSSPEYRTRLEMELTLIQKKEYTDYFLVVSDIVNTTKNQMLVGPSRGSSAGSLVCYLIGITEIDPIKHELLFERFIDANRSDLPDIDIDFPDNKRQLVIKNVSKKYGENNVAHIGTISRYKPRSAITDFSIGLNVPAYEIESLKNAIVERPIGDSRMNVRIKDTFETTEIGKEFIEHNPMMKLTEKIEEHARHAGVHAAGILITNSKLTNYVGINSRENVAMIDGKEAEYLNLLKIDFLGLRTLAILEDVAKQIGKNIHFYYDLPLDDENVFSIFNNMRLSGIFQFEGYALQTITRQMGVQNFNDIVAITSIGRPGPLNSGGASLFIARRTGEEPIEYLSKHQAIIKHTKDTYGIIIFQEQLMSIAREYGKVSWEDVQNIRKASAKSLGEEHLDQYKTKFLSGTRSQGIQDNEALKVWENMVTFGSYAFNKSHAVSYGLISYWCAWAKTYYPLEFAVANLNNTRNDESAIQILRDLVKNEGIEYIPVDSEFSEVNWTVHDGKLLGGLTNIDGIGIVKARKIIKDRDEDANFTAAMENKLSNAKTAFDILFPCEEYWGDFYRNPNKYGLIHRPYYIEEIQENGIYVFIGKLIDKNLRDANDYQNIIKRNGKRYTGQPLYLNFKLQDDTGTIMCIITRDDYLEKGQSIYENGIIDEDWFIVKAILKGTFRLATVLEIMKLEKNTDYSN